jgi:hypothetical protein
LLHIVPGLETRRQVDPKVLGWPEERRAASTDGLLINHHYIDMRGFSSADAELALLHERELYAELEAGGWADDVVADLIDMNYMDPDTYGFDLGMVGAVLALSSIGAVPVSCCNGGVFGDMAHGENQPCLIFYARPDQLEVLMAAAEAADVSMINNQDLIEVYTEDVRKIHQFGIQLLTVS